MQRVTRHVPRPFTRRAETFLNTIHGPFSNILAREAVAYATDSKALVAGLYDGAYKTVQSQTAPGQLFYTQTNKYYRGYNLAKAKALVAAARWTERRPLHDDQQRLLHQRGASDRDDVGSSRHQGHIQDYSLQQMLGITFSGAWQAIDENWGVGTDPGINDSEFFAEPLCWNRVLREQQRRSCRAC